MLHCSTMLSPRPSGSGRRCCGRRPLSRRPPGTPSSPIPRATSSLSTRRTLRHFRRQSPIDAAGTGRPRLRRHAGALDAAYDDTGVPNITTKRKQRNVLYRRLNPSRKHAAADHHRGAIRRRRGCRATRDIPVTWDEQVQAAVDCYNAGATMLHVHVRNPATGTARSDFDQYNYLLGRLRKAVPKMILQVGGSISFSPKTRGREGEVARLRHPPHAHGTRPEAGVRHRRDRHDACWTSSRCGRTEDIKGTHLEDPKVQAAWAGMCRRCRSGLLPRAPEAPPRKNGIQPYFMPAHVHQLEIIERLIRAGVYMGPLNMAIAGYGGGRMRPQSVRLDGVAPPHAAGCRRHILVRHAGLISLSAMAIILGQHVRVGNEDNIWSSEARAHDDGQADRGGGAHLRANSAARLRRRRRRARS